jgi:cell division protein FtsQ
MDDRGRLAQPLTWLAWSRRVRPGLASAAQPAPTEAANPRSRFARIADRWSLILHRRVPRGIGLVATILVLAASLAYGVVKGDHVPAVVAGFKDARDALANAAGFRIRAIALSGHQHVSREEVLATAGITGSTSLLFLDVDRARERLKANPWIADASLLKLYPGELQISIKEREAFALWQKDGRLSVIADDGTVLEPFVAPSLLRLPLVVGLGAQARAKPFLTLLDRYPELRDVVRAAVLIADRRWNLRLKNGIDVQLPESQVEAALDRLVALDREKNLTTRDIATIDLRLPDRVTVRLSERAAQARAEALKEKKPAKRGRDT